MLLLPPVNVGGVPPGAVPRSPSGTVVLSWCYRGTIVVLACYRIDAEMTRQERSLSALSMQGAKQQRGRRLTVGPESLRPSSHFSIFIFQFSFCIRPSSGKNLKMGDFGRVLSNFVPQGIHPGHSAPSPILPAGKHYTTSTVLSSGEALKKTNSVGIMLNSSPVIAPPFAPGGSLSFPADCRLPAAKARRRRLRRGLPTAYCPWIPLPLAFSSLIFALLASWRFALFLFSLPTAAATATATATATARFRAAP